MRASTDPTDPGYEYWRNRKERGYRLECRLDGEKVSRVITADTDEGIVIRHKEDADGKALIDREREEIVREELRGCVEIVELEDEAL